MRNLNICIDLPLKRILTRIGIFVPDFMLGTRPKARAFRRSLCNFKIYSSFKSATVASFEHFFPKLFCYLMKKKWIIHWIMLRRQCDLVDFNRKYKRHCFYYCRQYDHCTANSSLSTQPLATSKSKRSQKFQTLWNSSRSQLQFKWLNFQLNKNIYTVSNPKFLFKWKYSSDVFTRSTMCIVNKLSEK